MNARNLFVFIVLLFSVVVCAQEKELDSLDNIFSNIKTDSLLFIEFGKTANYFRNKKSDLHFYVVNRAIEHSTFKENIQQEAKFTRELGIYYRKKGILDSAIICYNNAIKKFESIQDSIGFNNTKSSLANALKGKGNYPKAIQYFNDVITFLETQKGKSKINLLINKFNLAGVYQEMSDWENADRYYEEIYEDSLAKTNKALFRSLCINLASTKQRVNRLDKALEYAKIAEQTETRPRSLANLFINIGTIYEKQKKHQKAHSYYLKSLQKFTDLKSVNGIQMAYNNLGNNSILWKKYDQAEEYLLKSKELLVETDNIKSQLYNYEMLAILYEKKGDYKKSLLYMKKEMELKDSILGFEKQKVIADFEVKYKTEKVKREKETAEQQAEIAKLETQRNKYLLISACIIALLILVASLFYLNRLKAKKKAEVTLIELKETQKRLALEKQYRDTELKALKAQMNPHFIFNALNSIQEYILLNQKKLASDYLGKFADLIRTYLNHSDAGYISIAEEIESLNLYLELEKLRFEDKLNYTISVEDTIPIESYAIPTMFIQPYIENALKHGLLHKKEDRKLNISFKQEEDSVIECIITDNGIGSAKSQIINSKKQRLHKSFALKASKSRLELLNEKTDHKIGVEIEDLFTNEEASGTKVTLKIPLTRL